MTLPGFTADASLYRARGRYLAGLGKLPLTETDVRNLHRGALRHTLPEIAGQYSKVGRYVRTEAGRHYFPPPAEIPTLMRNFAKWLGSAPDTPETAFAAHRRLVDIHPFTDGNGRTARGLVNLILTRGGYPPITVRPEDRTGYFRALERWQSGQENEDFDSLLYERLRAQLGLCKKGNQFRGHS